MELTLDGFDAFVRHLTSELPGGVLDAIGDSLKTEMDAVMERSRELCPVLTGALRDSGAVSDPIFGYRQVVVQLSYGGDNGEIHYALMQHEVLDFRHDRGEAKYLEKPLLAWEDDGPRRTLEAAAVLLGAS